MGKAEEKNRIETRIKEIEAAMNQADFWNDKSKAQSLIKELGDLKTELEGGTKYDNGPAILNIFAGAGGQDSEDFVRILLNMYLKYAEGKGWGISTLNSHETDHGGYRNVTIEIDGSSSNKGVYGTLKNESGVHRLVRISPFNAQKKRHTSFAMVEIVPRVADTKEVEINESDLEIDFSKSSGPGGQNVNKRETAVRVLHKPTNISVHSDSERTQERNRDKALEILRGKLYHKYEEDRKKEAKGLSISAKVQNEWGSQIRSYVLHPYQMIKDHRTDVEIRDVDKVLDGGLQDFVDAEKNI